MRNFSRVKLWFVYALFPYLINWHYGQGHASSLQTRLQGLRFSIETFFLIDDLEKV